MWNWPNQAKDYRGGPIMVPSTETLAFGLKYFDIF